MSVYAEQGELRSAPTTLEPVASKGSVADFATTFLPLLDGGRQSRNVRSISSPEPIMAGAKHVGYYRVPQPMDVVKAGRPLKILFVYSRSPFPMVRGDQQHVAHLLEFFHARGHTVDLVTLCSPGTATRPEHDAWLASRCRRVEMVPMRTSESLVEAGLGLLRGLPFQVGYLYSRAQRRRALELAETESYDIAFGFYVRSAEVLRAVAGFAKASVLTLGLSQTLNTRRLARNAVTWYERLFYRFEHGRIETYEARLWKNFSRVAMVGQSDIEAVEQACIRRCQPVIDNAILGPHGIDVRRSVPAGTGVEQAGMVVMTGVMSYAPNVEGARWFCHHIWPLVRSRHPDAKLFLVGRDPAPAVQALHGSAGVEVTGTVDEMSDWIARAAVCVAPIRCAAGQQNKLLEAMALGKAIVATPEANEGVGGLPGRDLLVARGADLFADAVVEALEDPALRTRLGRAARLFVETYWTHEAVFSRLDEELLGLVQAGEREAGDVPALAAEAPTTRAA